MMSIRRRVAATVHPIGCFIALAACAGDAANASEAEPKVAPPSMVQPATGSAGAGQPNTSSESGDFGGSPGASSGTAGAAAPAAQPASGSGSQPPLAGPGAMMPGVPPAGMPPATGGAPSPATPGPATPSGPEDGDTSQPVVAVPGLPCGPNPSLFGLTTTNTTIGGRDVHVAYPCNKHKGAPMVFILNLHGTMPDESLKLYQVAYFSANTLVDSHNFITAAPKSVVSQWGNGDNGADLPHIMAVIDWVYTTFADFDIRAMWVSGHSWGAMYSTDFACKPELADKIKGAVLESGSGLPPACASRISLISTAAESDIGPVIDQGAIAAGHGCGAAQMNMIGNNKETYWPDCDGGFVHGNYFMLGKAHADYIDAEVVERIGDLIKLARP